MIALRPEAGEKAIFCICSRESLLLLSVMIVFILSSSCFRELYDGPLLNGLALDHYYSTFLHHYG
jgi:hypothetical protein